MLAVSLQEKMEGLDGQVAKLASQVDELAHINEELLQQKIALQQAADQRRCGRCGGALLTANPCAEVLQQAAARPAGFSQAGKPSTISEMTLAVSKV